MKRLLWISAVSATMLLGLTAMTSAQEKDNDKHKKKSDPSMTEQVEGVTKKIDEDPRAQKVSAGILHPIYELAETFSFPAFHWIAFFLMVTGVVSFAGQLILGKLLVLGKGSFSFIELLSDASGLIISLVGLVLTTQAAAENSTFTQSPAAVLSATIAGIIVGIVFMSRGVSQEIRAVDNKG